MLRVLLLLGCWPPSDVTPLLTTWNNATVAALQAFAKRSLPAAVRQELPEAAMHEAEPTDPRRSFLGYLQQQRLLPFPDSSLLVERPRSGEQVVLNVYLLRKAGTGYAVTHFYQSGIGSWQTGQRAVLARSAIEDLVSDRRCFHQGHNQEPVTVTQFTAGGLRATAQYFPSDTFCGTVDWP